MDEPRYTGLPGNFIVEAVRDVLPPGTHRVHLGDATKLADLLMAYAAENNLSDLDRIETWQCMLLLLIELDTECNFREGYVPPGIISEARKIEYSDATNWVCGNRDGDAKVLFTY